MAPIDTVTDPTTTSSPRARYARPGWLTRHVVNPAVRRLARLGAAPDGLRELRVLGRRSGQVRSVPVNVLDLDGRRYLVAPRGATEWVRNLRTAGEGELRLGRRVERFRAVELADTDKPPLLREYLRRWRSQVSSLVGDLDHASNDDVLAAAAPGFPVFEVHPS